MGQAYPRKELGDYRDEASGREVLLELQRSPRTERLQVVVRKMCQMISSLRRAEGLWLQNEVQFSESWRFWGSHHHNDARDLQVRILGLEPAPPFCEYLCDLPGSCRTEFGLGGGHFP